MSKDFHFIILKSEQVKGKELRYLIWSVTIALDIFKHIFLGFIFGGLIFGEAYIQGFSVYRDVILGCERDIFLIFIKVIPRLLDYNFVLSIDQLNHDV